MSVLGVVLAAGGGSRFAGGGHKLLASWRGGPIVASVLDAAVAARLDEIAVVTGAVDLGDLVPPDVVVLENPRWSEGLATSLQCALAHARLAGHDAVVIGLGDMPGVPAEAWSAVAATGADVAVASFGGERRPPVRLGSSRWSDVPSSGDVGARALWHGEGAVVVECVGDPTDIDTVEDLSRLAASDRG